VLGSVLEQVDGPDSGDGDARSAPALYTDSVSVTVGAGSKRALTVRSWVIVTEHGPNMPLHAPPQPLNTLSGAGVAITDVIAPLL
jgi:hypothetical protein